MIFILKNLKVLLKGIYVKIYVFKQDISIYKSLSNIIANFWRIPNYYKLMKTNFTKYKYLC